MRGARASLEVRSKAIGGDLARFGAGGVPARGGDEVARDMVVPVVVEDHPEAGRRYWRKLDLNGQSKSFTVRSEEGRRRIMERLVVGRQGLCC
jgi:hypothetical protein